jgi:hypothetical protein
VEIKPYLEERLREITGNLSIINQTNISENVVNWLRLYSRNNWVLVLNDIREEFQPISIISSDDVLLLSTLLFCALEGDKKTLEELLKTALESEEARVIIPHPTMIESLKVLK